VKAEASQNAWNSAIISYFGDTTTFRSNPVCIKYPDALYIHLYGDAFEISNEFWSSTGVHKLETLFMQVRNVPLHAQA
jgi:hypothetical protein